MNAREVVHDCPRDGEQATLCCGSSPFELPRMDRMTLDPALVTCGAGQASDERCPHSCGINEVHARDGVAYWPPLVEIANCGLVAGHPGECSP